LLFATPATPPPLTSTLSLHDALPISAMDVGAGGARSGAVGGARCLDEDVGAGDAMVLYQMLDGKLGLAARGEMAGDRAFHRSLLTRVGPSRPAQVRTRGTG